MADRHSANNNYALVVSNEFASARISVDDRGHRQRLMIENLETGTTASFDPLELVSLCEWPESARPELLRIGAYAKGQ
jgi:hypothetical protein